jgi:hypothetical protein
VLTVRFRIYCLPLLLPEQAYSFTVSPTYTAPKHPANSSLPLVLYAVGVKELLWTDLPRAPLLPVISRLYPTLIAPADFVPLLVRPTKVLLCPLKAEPLVLGRDRGLASPYTTTISFFLKGCPYSFLPTALAKPFW